MLITLPLKVYRNEYISFRTKNIISAVMYVMFISLAISFLSLFIGDTACMWAARMGHTDCVRLLIQSMGDVACTNKVYIYIYMNITLYIFMYKQLLVVVYIG